MDRLEVGDARPLEEAVEQKIAALRNALVSLTGGSRSSSDSMLIGELSDAFEELEVVAEELRQRNEELGAAHEALDQERRRYQELFDFAPDGYLETDRFGVIRRANPAAAGLFGVSTQRLVGKPLITFVAASDRRAFRIQLALLGDGHALRGREVSLTPRGGVPFLASIDVEPAFDASEAGSGFRWLLRDVTERARAEELLRKNEARLQVLLEQAPAIVWTTDRDLRVTSSEGAGLGGLGLKPGQLVGAELSDYLGTTDPDYPPIGAHLRALEGESVSYEMEFAGRAYRTTVEPLRDARGNVVGCIGMSLDDSERHRALQELKLALTREREAAQRLRSLDELRNALLTAVSHDLRGPLTAVLGFALTLQRIGDLSGVDAEDLLRRLAANARKLDRVFRDLLDLDRLQQGITEPVRFPTNLAVLAQRVVEELATSDHPVCVEAESLTADVDPRKVERIVENLLSNAMKHTAPKTPIWLRVQRVADGILIVVEDAGAGVPGDLKDRVFDAFERAPGSGSTPGTGIGLSVVARFAGLLGGRAWVEDRPGGGTSFRVFLPVPDQTPSPD